MNPISPGVKIPKERIRELIQNNPQQAIRLYGDLLTPSELSECMTEEGLTALLHVPHRLDNDQILAFAEGFPSQVLASCGKRLLEINPETFHKIAVEKPDSAIAHCADILTDSLREKILSTSKSTDGMLWAIGHAGSKLPAHALRSFLKTNGRDLARKLLDTEKSPYLDQLVKAVHQDLPWIRENLPRLGKLLQREIAKLI